MPSPSRSPTKAIVVNKCHGGFGLSREAWLWLRDHGQKEALAEPDVGEYYDDGSGPRTSFGSLESFGRDVPRDDPLLVEVVESMGEKASGAMAELRVVKIPADVEWKIEEYDGLEWVAEKHRTW